MNMCVCVRRGLLSVGVFSCVLCLKRGGLAYGAQRC